MWLGAHHVQVTFLIKYGQLSFCPSLPAQCLSPVLTFYSVLVVIQNRLLELVALLSRTRLGQFELGYPRFPITLHQALNLD
jgi:hypothetical protein